jgi:hypothetical protein
MTDGARVTGIDQLLAQARAAMRRLEPQQALEAAQCGPIPMDGRSDFQRRADGEIPGAVICDASACRRRPVSSVASARGETPACP